MTTPILLLLGLVLTMLTGLGLAGAAIKRDRRMFKDEVPDIQAELALNAKIRELQGINRVGDELTEKYKSVEHVGRVREQIISRGEIIDVLTATGGLSEGVTADAIIAAMLTASKEKVLVPEEPTAKMIRAGQIASREWSASDSTENGLIPIYRAMLTASKEGAE